MTRRQRQSSQQIGEPSSFETNGSGALDLGYDRDAVEFGVMHIGPGRFHRAHQAFYFNELLKRDTRWGVEAVSMRSTWLKEQLADQSNLYTLKIVGQNEAILPIGSIIGINSWSNDRKRVIDLFCDPRLKLITLTITEAGYYASHDGTLNLDAPEIANDLASPAQSKTAIGLLVYGLRARWKEGLEPPNILSCDNVSRNGNVLRNACICLARQVDRDFSSYLERSVSFPNSVVDSITPASPPELAEEVRRELGFNDHAPVLREEFSEWIIEDKFAGERPRLDVVGVQFVDDIEPYERRKLRILNASHTILAILGLQKGLNTVFDALNDEHIRRFLEAALANCILPSLNGPTSVLTIYVENMYRRFQNPRIPHLLDQIIENTSVKLENRILPAVSLLLKSNQRYDELLVLVISWIVFIGKRHDANEEFSDPIFSSKSQVLGDAPLSERVLAYLDSSSLSALDASDKSRLHRRVAELLELHFSQSAEAPLAYLER